MNSARPKVSVVCAWYNRADYIEDTIDSVLAQEFDNFEFIVVNDGSSDPRVREILNSYNDPRLRVIHQENTGFTTAIGRAIKESNGEYVAIQGAGDISLPQRLATQVARIENDSFAVGVGSARENIWVGGDKDGKRVTIRIPIDVVMLSDLLRLKSNPLNHGDLLYRRSVYDKVGGYRPFFRFAQDMDLLLRMGRHGGYLACHEVLSQRLVFASDGISSKIDKTLAQTKYAEIAKACIAEADKYGRDVVDVFGMEAGLFLSSSRFIANITAKTSLKYFRLGRYVDAVYLAELAMRETPISLAPLAKSAAILSHSSFGRRVVKGLLKMVPMREQRQFSNIMSS